MASRPSYWDLTKDKLCDAIPTTLFHISFLFFLPFFFSASLSLSLTLLH